MMSSWPRRLRNFLQRWEITNFASLPRRSEDRNGPLRITTSFPEIIVGILVFTFFQLAEKNAAAQSKDAYLLFVLDASGSMKGEWKGKSKFELAGEILSKTVDSITQSNQKVQCALRAFGHQSPRAANNCKDTKLEVPFSKANASSIVQRLKQIHPQGQTPIEFTLKQSLKDFPDSNANNAIILITDGNETCGGDLCKLASEMASKHIALRPFIVGLGLNDSLKKKFECLGNFYDVQSEDMFSSAMRVIITRVLNPTTCQINLLDAYGNATETNVEMTLYDHHTRQVKYQFIHTLSSRGTPDTLVLDPKFVYDLTVHSIPEVRKTEMELVPGTHNIVAATVPMGTLDLPMDGIQAGAVVPPCIIRRAGEQEILHVQDAGTSLRYLAGSYDLEILTLPEIFLSNIQIEDAKTTSIKIARSGILLLTPSESGVASVFMERGDTTIKVYDFGSVKQQQTVNLQPGKYSVIFRPDKGKQAERTRQIPVQINSGKTTSIRL